MLTLLPALLDPELGSVPFTVDRLTCRRSVGTVTSSSQTFSAVGNIHPGTPEMIQLLPEEDRHETFIAIYTDFALSPGTNSGLTITCTGVSLQKIPDRTYDRASTNVSWTLLAATITDQG